jgi:hypothetical protein
MVGLARGADWGSPLAIGSPRLPIVGPACQVNLNILHIIFLTIINSHQEIMLLTKI